MRQYHLLLATLAVVAACTDVPDDEYGEQTQNVLIENRIASNRISSNRISTNRISSNRISSNRIATNRYTANEAAMGDLLDTPNGQQLLAFLLSCALPDGVTLTAADPNHGPDIVFVGEIGVAPGWVDRPLSGSERRWVSACLLSRVNDNNVAVEISMRGPNTALAAAAAEHVSHPLEEGAFYGDIFGPLDQPLRWYACRGRAQAAGEPGGTGLEFRDCAEPSTTDPTVTQCGFTYAGDCADFVAPANDYACQKFSATGTYYENCKIEASRWGKGHSSHKGDHPGKKSHGRYGNHDRSNGSHSGGDHDNGDCGDDHDDDDGFDEVITVFVTP